MIATEHAFDLASERGALEAVLSTGFEFKGDRYDSLSAIAKAVTGSHINGFRFFRLVKVAA